MRPSLRKSTPVFRARQPTEQTHASNLLALVVGNLVVGADYKIATLPVVDHGTLLDKIALAQRRRDRLHVHKGDDSGVMKGKQQHQ